MWKDPTLCLSENEIPSDNFLLSQDSANTNHRPEFSSIITPLTRKGAVSRDEEFPRNLNGAPFKTLFPTTRYYGSKRRQLGWIREELNRLSGVTALDAFGGTGAVTYLLQSLGWTATYNDIFQFNTVAARALFSNSTTRITSKQILDFINSIEPIFGFISEKFKGIYFTHDENMWLDGYMTLLLNESKEHYELLLYCLFQACLKKRPFNLFHRANLNLRTSTIPVKFGNRSTWDKSFQAHILETYNEVKIAQGQFEPKILVTSGGCATEVAPPYDLIYLDPPYFKKSKKNTETYIERYHFLEGLTHYKNWNNFIDPSSPIGGRFQVPSATLG